MPFPLSVEAGRGALFAGLKEHWQQDRVVEAACFGLAKVVSNLSEQNRSQRSKGPSDVFCVPRGVITVKLLCNY